MLTTQNGLGRDFSNLKERFNNGEPGLFLFDMTGTLLNQREGCSESVLKSLKRICDQGSHVLIVTADSVEAVTRDLILEAKKLGVEIPRGKLHVASSVGAVLHTFEDRKLIEVHKEPPLERALQEELFQLVLDKVREKAARDGRTFTEPNENQKQAFLLGKRLDMADFTDHPGLKKFEFEGLSNKFGVFDIRSKPSLPKVASELLREINSEVGDVVRRHNPDLFITLGHNYTDIHSSDKPAGVKTALKQIPALSESNFTFVASFGDSSNDLGLLTQMHLPDVPHIAHYVGKDPMFFDTLQRYSANAGTKHSISQPRVMGNNGEPLYYEQATEYFLLKLTEAKSD